MKKITLGLCLLNFFFSQATIIVKDIPDFTFTPNASLAFDFNSDGTTEFIFEEMNIVGTFYDSNNVNFMGYGSFDSGYGWDVMKSLSSGTVIGASSPFYGEGDAYINPFWANQEHYFPAGDSYVGTKFKIGANTHYGWILVNSTGGAQGTITVKSYAYNNVPNGNITAGQTLANSQFNADFEVQVFPNPTVNYVTIKTDKNISSVLVYNIKGEVIKINNDNNTLDFAPLATGIYFLKISSNEGQQANVTLIKK
ncbi:T9SS type A sorting domain-containing protein [Flavobacterium sp.]